jgi:capsular polysaccharide export protein
MTARLGKYVVSGAASIALKNKGESLPIVGSEAVDAEARSFAGAVHPRLKLRKPFLRIPPFPGAKLQQFVELPGPASDPCDLADEFRRLRVGGTYWAAQPEIGSGCVVVRLAAGLAIAPQLAPGGEVVFWPSHDDAQQPVAGIRTIAGECDPWHVLSSAAAVVLEPDDELRLIAALLDVSAYLHDPATGEIDLDRRGMAVLLADALASTAFKNPFTDAPMSAREASELCAFWRRLIDSNRGIAGGLGFAFWKQAHVAPLLWNGSEPFRFFRGAAEVRPGATVAAWRAKVPQHALERLERLDHPLIDVEDGFLRSRGLGADCIPPLSIAVDRRGAHFDPSRPSELEDWLQNGEIDGELVRRARDLRELIVEAGIGKYERGGVLLERPAGDRRHILVPGQVEDDRAVTCGGCGLTSNLELLRRVREQAPDAYILYKPHPDVLAGHRRGAIPSRTCLQYADEVVGELPIGSLIAIADEVHVNSSLAGFEALLRGKEVVTYGVPFYAGWGLTRDLGPVPARRTTKRTINELAAAALLLYPRYFDPVTGLPCPAEIVVARLCAEVERDAGLLVGMRRLQGKIMRRLRSLVQ